jgi:hypothetical protein
MAPIPVARNPININTKDITPSSSPAASPALIVNRFCLPCHDQASYPEAPMSNLVSNLGS